MILKYWDCEPSWACCELLRHDSLSQKLKFIKQWSAPYWVTIHKSHWPAVLNPMAPNPNPLECVWVCVCACVCTCVHMCTCVCSSFFDMYLFIFYWNIVDLQCCVNFSCTAKWFSYTHTHTHTHTHIYTFFFYILFHYGLSQGSEYSSLCFTVGPCCVSILYIIVCIY